MKFRSAVALIAVALIGGAMAATASAQTSTETVLYSLTGTNGDGAFPDAGLIMDSSGNLFGTTEEGGSEGGFGTVFEMVKSNNNYAPSILYSFTNANGDGQYPYAGLVMDSSGDLFGTTGSGGGHGYGIVFELVNHGILGYPVRLLYTFTDANGDGAYPFSGLVIDKAGNLLGTTSGGGTDGDGTVFELVNSSGKYTENVLYSFHGTKSDGANPYADLLMDSAGNLYGTTKSAGTNGDGTVFELAKGLTGYTEKVLYSFRGTKSDGANPEAGLIMDGSGNLYGTTYRGGSGFGTVFELVKSSGGYTEKVLYSFGGAGVGDGDSPRAGLVMDAAGNLYGTTELGGAAGDGRVFELSNSSSGYIQTVVHDFLGPNGPNAPDGKGPVAGLLMDSSGHLFGTTRLGGGGANNADGTVFEITLPVAPQAALSSSNLSFGSQLINTATAAQTITVKNSGNANLTFASGAVTLSGANAADFALSSDSCSGQTLKPGSSCAAAVTFTPSHGGNETATLNFADNAANTPQTAALSGQGADFSIAAASGSSSSATVTKGSRANYSLALTPQGGFNQALSLTCTGAPAESTCTFSPSSVTLNGSSPATVKVTVSTTASSMLVPPVGWPPLSGRWLEVLLLGILSLLGVFVFVTKRRADARPRRLQWATIGAGLVLVVVLFASCGGGGSSGGGSSSNPGTPTGSYMLTVKASTASGFQQSTSLTLTVK